MSLGRGLESLIPKTKKVSEAGFASDREAVSPSSEKPISSPTREDSIFYIETEKIKPNPFQPRRDFDAAELASLAESMKEYGVIQPLLVSKIQTEVPSGTKVEYQLIAGERRLKAATLAGLKQVPVIIKKNTNDVNKLELALIENVQRQNLNPLEEARAYKRLVEEFRTHPNQIAEKVGKSREVVLNRMRLLDLPYDVQQSLSSGQIAEGHAKVLLAIKNPERQIHLAGEIFKKGMTVRDLEEIVKQDETYKAKSPRTLDPVLEHHKKMLQDVLGTAVVISGNLDRGRLAVSFYSEEDLDRLIKKLIS